jgi:hypothetical protein
MSASVSDPNAGAPVQKTVDMAVGAAKDAAPSESSAKTDTPVQPGEDKKEGAPPEAPAQVAVPPKDRLAGARRQVRERAQFFAERQAAQLEAQRQAQSSSQYQQIAQQERAAREAYERQLKEITSDPMAGLAFLEKAGLDAKTLTQKAIEANSPEGKLRAELEAKFEARFAEVQKTYDARIAEIQQREQTQAQAVTRAQAQQRFMTEAADAERFPSVSQLLEKGEEWKTSLLSEATRVLQDAFQKTGQHYTNEEVLSYLDRKYSQLVPPKPKNGAALSNAEVGKTDSGTSNAAGSSRTITNDAAQVKGSLPPNFDDLPDADQKKALAAMLRQLSRK